MALQKQQLMVPSRKTAYDSIKDMMTSKGLIALDPDNFMANVMRFQEVLEEGKAQYPLWEILLNSQPEAGLAIQPMVVIPGKEDAWRQGESIELGRKCSVPLGTRVEPSAEFVCKLGTYLGVKTQKVFEGLDELAGVPQYRVDYTASLLLANGVKLEIPGGTAGKMQALKTNAGNVQEHIAENTRKKALRNAIKELLGLQLTYEPQDFFKPWILPRLVITDRNAGLLARQMAAEHDQLKAQSTAALYASITPVEIAPIELDPLLVQAHIDGATTLEELAAVGASLKAKNTLSEHDRQMLRAKYGQRQRELKTELAAATTQQPESQEGELKL